MAKEMPQDEGPLPAPAWIVTFTDMMSLLLTFFILLLTFTTSSTDKFQQMSGSLSGAFGVGAKTSIPKPSVGQTLSVTKAAKDSQGDETSPLRQDEIEKTMYGVQSKKDFKTRITVDEVIQGFRLRLEAVEGAEPFILGTSELTDNSKDVLREVANFFKARDCRLVIETHVDSKTWRAGSYDTAERLTAELAVAGAKIIEEAGFIPENIGISPRGFQSPLVENDTAIRRAKNRRIEILVLPHNQDPLFDNNQAR